MHHAFLYISLPSLHDYRVKLPNFTFYGGSKHKTTTYFNFLFFELRYSDLEFKSKIIYQNIRQNERDEISVIKFELVQIAFLSDVFLTFDVFCIVKTAGRFIVHCCLLCCESTATDKIDKVLSLLRAYRLKYKSIVPVHIFRSSTQ